MQFQEVRMANAVCVREGVGLRLRLCGYIKHLKTIFKLFQKASVYETPSCVRTLLGTLCIIFVVPITISHCRYYKQGN
jgi:hypothetical protein